MAQAIKRDALGIYYLEEIPEENEVEGEEAPVPAQEPEQHEPSFTEEVKEVEKLNAFGMPKEKEAKMPKVRKPKVPKVRKRALRSDAGKKRAKKA